MEIIEINESKMKIIMSATDMERYGLDENEFYSKGASIKELLHDILTDEKHSDGFCQTNAQERLCVQLYPEINGGCELYITKINLEDSEGDITPMSEPTNDKRLPVKAGISISHNYIYCFNSFRDLLAACKVIERCNVQSSLYRNEQGVYYLNAKFSADESKKCPPETALAEFGEQLRGNNVELGMGEYAKCLIRSNAISYLSKL